jgi:hypothetical protein
MKTAIAVLFAASLIVACTSTQRVNDRRYPPASVSSVKVLYQEPKQAYEVIALLNRRSGVEHPVTGDVSGLREEAARLGADALMIASDVLSGLNVQPIAPPTAARREVHI